MTRIGHIKKYISFLIKSYQDTSKPINAMLSVEPALSFDRQSNCFSINDPGLSWERKVSLRSDIINGLRQIHPEASARLSDIRTGHYDLCLEKYLYERRDLGLPNEETCWFKTAQNNKCIGWVDPVLDFDNEAKTTFLKERGKQKASLSDPALAELLKRNPEGFVFLMSNNIYTEDDKVLSICSSIEKNGFSNILSSLLPIMLGLSEKTGRYSVVSGRHRIAALKYLNKQGKIEDDLEIKCHLLKYPFESLVFTRPYSAACIECVEEGT